MLEYSQINAWFFRYKVPVALGWEIIDIHGQPADEAELMEAMVRHLIVQIDLAVEDPTYLTLSRFLYHDIHLLHDLAPYLLPHQRALLQDAADSDTPVIESAVRIMLLGTTP